MKSWFQCFSLRVALVVTVVRRGCSAITSLLTVKHKIRFRCIQRQGVHQKLVPMPQFAGCTCGCLLVVRFSERVSPWRSRDRGSNKVQKMEVIVFCLPSSQKNFSKKEPCYLRSAAASAVVTAAPTAAPCADVLPTAFFGSYGGLSFRSGLERSLGAENGGNADEACEATNEPLDLKKLHLARLVLAQVQNSRPWLGHSFFVTC